MRLFRSKIVIDDGQPTPTVLLENGASTIEGRKKQLEAVIQAALRVGADLAAREAGRRAFAGYLKLDKQICRVTRPAVSADEPMLFAYSKRRRTRPSA
jgi:hypothetical protein